jgi:EAL domain-containing protein (putative c-di-GMP-specific phosphodiesterase class I)/GGDEF domain-containing protein
MRIASNGFTRALAQIGAALRRPEMTLFIPALALAAFWLGGERALVLTALAMPALFALTGLFGGLPAAPPAVWQGGLGHRNQLVQALDATLARAEDIGLTTACLVLQFDEADRLVDRYGRAAQSEILQLCGDRLLGALRRGDTVAGLEGGGFAVALGPVRRVDLETLIQISGRLQAALAAPISLEGGPVYVTCSVGFCLVARAPERTGRALLDAAQVAADVALRHGPGGIRSFAPDMARTRADREASRDAIEAALDAGQIRPHFQPQISTDTGAVTGFEALARWHHPERGLLLPGEFLAPLEEVGLSERLGEVMLFHALSALAQWDKAGLAVPTVAVNFSAAELRNPRLPERIQWELDRFDLSPARLTVEILETVVTQTDNDVIVRNVAALAALGCGIDLDDFGTGHASITNLRRFQVRRIKIDRSMVTRVDDDRDQQKIVSAILSLADRLGLDTLAEGVETQGEHAMLAQLGCGHVQGFGIGRPMALEDTGEWIRRHGSTTPRPPSLRHRTA